ncbi:DUF84 family protein [Metabacillus indicus]|uniref:inosine/xanthosine triphosphatase n=1 Tax=Metabacillus indicus TaxID=246786 RepID=A0A084H0S2_METID|nr:DUF84 family protein [Metabacillus indicus]KEZ53184.1 NTPase [Metabacillus indicus]
MKIAIGTLNQAKVNAVKECIDQLGSYTLSSTSVSSGVADQPFSDEETIQGAVNRAQRVREEENADIGIGLEGGMIETDEGFFLCNWGALSVQGTDPIIAGGARIPLPAEIGRKVKSGIELKLVMDEYADKENVSQKEGAVGIFTGGLVTRKEMFKHICLLLFGQYFYQIKQK